MTLIALLLLALASDQEVDLPVRHLAFKKGVVFTEGTRGMGDAFPYLQTKGKQQLTPENLHAILDGGIKSADAAYEAVRLFVAGVPVEDGTRLIAEARKLGKELKHHAIKIGELPKRWKRTVVKKADGWVVEFVAFEMDAILQLVQIHASVTTQGGLRIRRTAIVRGPMTVWQSAVVEGADAELAADNERAMRAEALRARARYAKALAAPRNLDTAFCIARLRLTPKQIADLWPGERRPAGSGRRLVAVDLKEGTSAIYDATVMDHPIDSLLINRGMESPMRRGVTLLRLAAAR